MSVFDLFKSRNVQECLTVGNFHAVYDQRSETFAKSRLRLRFKVSNCINRCDNYCLELIEPTLMLLITAEAEVKM